MKFLYSVIILLTYIISLLLIYLFYINSIKVDVLLYSSILCAFLALIVILILLFTAKFKIFNLFEKTCVVSICFLVGYSLAISLPTVIDRSLSFYILEKLNQRGGGIQLNKINLVFTNEYIEEHRLMEIRITEQLITKSVLIDNNCLRLTDKGKKLVHFSTFFRKYFLPKKRLIGEEYSDDLLLPLNNKTKVPDYLC